MAGLIGGSSSKTLRVKEFRASGVFPVPAGVKTVWLFLVGGGGGTGSETHTAGQGGNVVKVNYDVSGKASCNVAIGAGGGVGGDGGDTIFDGVVVAAGGAVNGVKGTSSTSTTTHDVPPAIKSGEDGFGGNGVVASYPFAAQPHNGAKTNSAGLANTGAGASGTSRTGGSGYARVEWYE